MGWLKMKYETRLPFFAVVRVTGDDRHPFLNSQLSNDLKNLLPNQACYATYNTPKGRVMANFLVSASDDAIYLAMANDLVENTIKRLKMFVLRAKVQFEILNDWGVSACLPDDVLPKIANAPSLSFPVENQEIQLPHGGTMRIAPLTELPEYNEIAEKAWQKHEIFSAYPWISLATTETCVAQMLNQHTIGGVHFRKGCYPGQEIIARAQYRGQVKRGLAIAKNLHKQDVGNEVRADNAEAGIVINTVDEWHLLVIKHGAANAVLSDEAGNIFEIQQVLFELPNETNESS